MILGQKYDYGTGAEVRDNTTVHGTGAEVCVAQRLNADKLSVMYRLKRSLLGTISGETVSNSQRSVPLSLS